MGNIREILCETVIGKKGIYENHSRLEIEENIHLHYRDGRYILKKEDFLNLVKLFNDAYLKYKEIGMPEFTKEMVQLSGGPLDNSIHGDRFGCELGYDDTIHIHYRDLRLHLNRPDFRIISESLHIGNMMLNIVEGKLIDLKDKNIRLHPVVYQHIENLKKYDNNEYPKENPDDIIKYLLDIKKRESHHDNDIKRPNGLPTNYPGKVPPELDKKYLFCMYESIKKYGYADAPFYGQYIIVYKENESTLYVKDSHRVSCLLHLGMTKVKALVTEPESGWKP